MGSSVFGFRVLNNPSPFTPGSPPTMVLYRLDPATLDFAEVGGSPERLLGFPRADWYRPRFWSGRIHRDDRMAVRAFFGSWAVMRQSAQLEYRVVDAAGDTVSVHHAIAVGRDAREQVAIRGVIIDITDRIARETEVEKALFLKSELFRIVAEELAPPVRAISVYCEMLERHVAAQRDDVGSDYAVGLRDELQRLDGTLGQLVRLAQNGMSLDEMNAGLAAFRGNGRPV